MTFKWDNDNADIRVHGAHGWSVTPTCTSIEPGRSYVLRCGIGGIYWTCYISVLIGNSILTGVGNLDTPYLMHATPSADTAAAIIVVRTRIAEWGTR